MPFYPFTLVRELVRCDVVHLHTPMPEAALVAAVARLLRKPVLITHHGDVVMPAGTMNGIVQRVMDAVILLSMRLADEIIVYVTDYSDHSDFLAPVRAKIRSIYPPVELPAPQPHEADRWRHELGLEGRHLIGFAGRFVEEKGFDFLLEAIPFVRARIPTAHFVFAGDLDVVYERFVDRLRPSLERERDALTELGLVLDPQKMANFYAMCDVFVLPSRTDCFAIVQVEALLTGTPLVTSDIPGAREVVRVTGAGTLVPAGDPAGIAEGIVRVLDDLETYRPEAAAIRETFDPERSVTEYEDRLMRVAKRRNRSGRG
jgi:glycosyltransferase involved in cell wall biosynthesis